MSVTVVGFVFFLFPALNERWNFGTCKIQWQVPKYGKLYDFIKIFADPLLGPAPQG